MVGDIISSVKSVWAKEDYSAAQSLILHPVKVHSESSVYVKYANGIGRGTDK